MNWVLALVIVAMVFVASCALWVGAFTKTTTDFLDFAVRVQCYDSGYYDAPTAWESARPAVTCPPATASIPTATTTDSRVDMTRPRNSGPATRWLPPS